MKLNERVWVVANKEGHLLKLDGYNQVYRHERDAVAIARVGNKRDGDGFWEAIAVVIVSRPWTS